MTMTKSVFPQTAVYRTVRGEISPADVHAVIGRHMLVDDLGFVVDLGKSTGPYIYDSKGGRRLLDFFSFVASMPVGLNHPKLNDAKFLEKLTAAALNKLTNSDAFSVEMAEFVETFARIAMPAYLPHVFFVEGGALAVENALKAAFDWKIRKNFAKGHKDERGTQVIHFKQAFHGRSGYTLSLTNTDPNKSALYPKFTWPRIPNPAIKFPLNEDNLQAVEIAERTAIHQIKEAFREHEDDIAAIILEPIQGEGGDNHFRKEFFVALRELADENEAMLIFDEVQTGVGLTGKMWAHEHFVRPDMISFGKKTQVCGFMAGRRIDEVKENVFSVASRINSTWGGGLVDMVRCGKYLEIIHEEKLVENAARVGDYLQQRLHALHEEFPHLVSNVRGRGLFCAFDLPDNDTRNKVKAGAYQNGLVILGSGQVSLRFRPPLIVGNEHIDEGVGMIRKALAGLKR